MVKKDCRLRPRSTTLENQPSAWSRAPPPCSMPRTISRPTSSSYRPADIRRPRRDGEGLPRRQMRRLLHRFLAARARSLAVRDARRLHHPARDHLQGTAGDRRRGRATTAGSRSRAGSILRCSMPTSSASRRRTSTRWSAPTIRRSSACWALADDDFGTPIGLTKDWAYRIVKASATTARCSTAMSARTRRSRLQPGLNALWKDGGIQYAPPIR